MSTTLSYWLRIDIESLIILLPHLILTGIDCNCLNISIKNHKLYPQLGIFISLGAGKCYRARPNDTFCYLLS